MKLLRDSSPLPSSLTGSVIALGNFDGLHLGHRTILAETLRIARSTNKPAGVLTFEPHPRRVFKPELPPLRIFPFRKKIELLAALGIDFLRVIRFTRAFAATSAEAFIHDILAQQLSVSHVITGDDFTFGHHRQGNAVLLQEQGKALGFRTTACPAVMHNAERCSSTRIRTLLAEGNVEQAAQLLGTAYTLSGVVRHGEQRGRTIGFPTANIVPCRVFLPASGVYAVRTQIDGKTVLGAAHLGTRPVFNSHEIRLETHLFDWQGDLYGKKIEIELVKRIRGELPIANEYILTEQIQKDCLQARAVLG